jgi:hypothetical protein
MDFLGIMVLMVVLMDTTLAMPVGMLVGMPVGMLVGMPVDILLRTVGQDRA